MGVPDHLLPHTVTLVRPAQVTDDYGNVTRDYSEGVATRTELRAWMQQDNREEARSDGREAAIQKWLMLTNHLDVQRHDRIEYGALTLGLDVEGPPEPVSTPAGPHHLEATLRAVDG